MQYATKLRKNTSVQSLDTMLEYLQWFTRICTIHIFFLNFNPSFPYRLVHMVIAAFLTTALVVGAVGAVHLLRDKADKEARRMFWAE